MLGDTVPLLAQVWPQFASRLIRNGATIGGNLVTASPIGDLAPGAARPRRDAGARVGRRRPRGGAGRVLHRLPRDRCSGPASWSGPSGCRRRSAEHTTFRKIAKRRYDDISSVAVAVALDVVDDTVVRGPHRPRRGRRHADPGAAPPRRRSRAGRGPRRPSRPRRRCWRARARRSTTSAPARRTAPRCSATPCAPGGPSHERRTRRCPTRARPSTSPVTRSTPTTWCTGRPHVLHAHPVCSPHAHARVTRLDPSPALAVDGVVRVLTADDVPGVNDAGVKHDEPLFPDEVMFVGHAVCWVLGETLEAARLGAAGRRGRLRAAAGDRRADRGDRRRELPGRPARRRAGRRRAGPGRGRARLQRRHRDGRPGALLPRDPRLARPRRRERPGLRAEQHPAPHRDAGDRRPRAGPRSPTP